MHVGGQEVVDLVVKQITLFFSQADQFVYLVELFVKRQCNGLPTGSRLVTLRNGNRRHAAPSLGGATVDNPEANLI
jgi:hypothetical protein